MAVEKLYDMWAKRNPQWETRYEDSVIRNFCDYTKGQTTMRDDRGKIFGAGYEIFIIAFFIGLYNDQRRPLISDSSKCKSFGWAIEN
ncbi:MAG TPA: glycoside hydrolase family 15, partial [Paludibacteraceae bacterium]|nr:glycoside hydrolase family 15 [Paludibacteraceae bacterium]